LYTFEKPILNQLIFENQLPETAPTAPKLSSSIIDASHSTFPFNVKFEPIPALVNGQS
jgi:hypothetical protein